MNNPQFLTPKQAAETFGYSPGTLANMRSQKVGPGYVKKGKKVLYPADQFKAWLEADAVLTADSLQCRNA